MDPWNCNFVVVCHNFCRLCWPVHPIPKSIDHLFDIFFSNRCFSERQTIVIMRLFNKRYETLLNFACVSGRWDGMNKWNGLNLSAAMISSHHIFHLLTIKRWHDKTEKHWRVKNSFLLHHLIILLSILQLFLFASSAVYISSSNQ